MSIVDKVAILPLGATEQHGPHLSEKTDALIAEGISSRLSHALKGNENISFLPVEEIGYSPEHLDYASTVSKPYDELIERWISIGEEVLAKGIRKVILLNAHGGNSPLLTIVATELRVRHSMLAVATSWTRMGYPDGMFSDSEKQFGIHGGDIETSVMMAMYPESVVQNSLQDFDSEQERFVEKYKHLRAYGKHAFGWKMQDLNPEGAVGNAANATVEKGEMLLQHSVKGLLKLIEEVAEFDMKQFDVADKATQYDENNS